MDTYNTCWVDDSTSVVTIAWTIQAKTMDNSSITVDANKYIYNGKDHTPTIVVKDGTKTLVEDTDYTVRIEKKESPAKLLALGVPSKTDGGEYNIYVDFKGNYQGNVLADTPLIIDNNLKAFVDNCMHLTDYKTSLGYCKGEDGYYYTAKAALLNLKGAHSVEEYIEFFRSDSYYSEALLRYETWANFNGDNSPYGEYTTANLLSFKNNINNYSDKVNNNNVAMIVTISSISTLLLAGAAIILFKKRKHN